MDSMCDRVLLMVSILQGVPRSGLDEGRQDGEDAVHHEDEPAFQ